MLQKSGGRRAFIVMPLAVQYGFAEDAAKVGVATAFVRSTDEVLAAEAGHERPIFLTNYDAAREGKVDLGLFDVLLLDEAAVLRSSGSQTFGEFLFRPAMDVPHRFVATATPSPNKLLRSSTTPTSWV